MTLFLVIAGIVFLFGLVQWARSGAILLDLHQILKRGSQPGVKGPLETDERAKEREKEAAKKTIQRMENTMDGFLRSSIRVLGALALCVWIFVAVSVVVDMLGLDWLDRLSFSANRVFGTPAARSSYNRAGGSSSARNNTLRSLGSNVRR